MAMEGRWEDGSHHTNQTRFGINVIQPYSDYYLRKTRNLWKDQEKRIVLSNSDYSALAYHGGP